MRWKNLNIRRKYFRTSACLQLLLIIAAGISYSKDIAVTAIYCKGKAEFQSGGTTNRLEAGCQLSAGDIVLTGPGGQAKLLIESSKTIVTVRENVKLSISSSDIKLLEGLEKNLIRKKLDGLRPDPQLGQATTQKAGAFVTRGAEPDNSATSAKVVSVVDDRPTFFWKDRGDFLLSLYEITSDGEKVFCWEKKAAADKLEYPSDSKALERGKSYYWERADLSSSNYPCVETGDLYVFKENEIKSYNFDLQELEKIRQSGEIDELAFCLITLELFEKYGLRFDADKTIRYLKDKYPLNEQIKKLEIQF